MTMMNRNYMLEKTLQRFRPLALLSIMLLVMLTTKSNAAITFTFPNGQTYFNPYSDPVSTTISGGAGIYLCVGANPVEFHAGYSGQSWTEDVYDDYYSSIGHQSGSTCSISSTGFSGHPNYFDIAGIGVSGYQSYSSYVTNPSIAGVGGSAAFAPITLPYTVPAGGGSVVIIVAVSAITNTDLVNPGGATPFTPNPPSGCSLVFLSTPYQTPGSPDFIWIYTCQTVAAGAYSLRADMPGMHSGSGVAISMAAYVFVPPAAPPPLSVSISASPSTITLTQSSQITGSVSGGTPAYFYQWRACYGAGCTPTVAGGTTYCGASATTFRCTFATNAGSSTGTYRFQLNAYDSGAPVQSVLSNIASVTLNPPPALVVSASGFPTQVVVSQQTVISGSASGGIQPYTYTWLANTPTSGPILTAAVAASICSFSGSPPMCTFSSATPGTYLFRLQVIDSEIPTVTRQSNLVQITVLPPLGVVISPGSQRVVATQQTATISSSVSGGIPFYTYTWYEQAPGVGNPFLPATDCSAPNSPTCIFTPTAATPTGTYTFYLLVRDSNNPQGSAQSNFVTVVVAPYLSGCGFIPDDLAQRLYIEAPWYCPINQQIYYQWIRQLPLALLAVLVSFSIAVLIFMLGIAARSERIKNFGIGEMYEAIATAIIVGLFLYVTAGVLGLLPSFIVGAINPYTTALNLMTNTINTAENMYTNLFNIYFFTKFLTTIETEIAITGTPIPLQTLFNVGRIPLNIFINDPAIALSSFLADGIAILWAEYYIIVFFALAAIPAFLVPGIVFRSIFPLRSLGGSLIALAIGFYLIMPTLFAVVYYFTAPGVQRQLAGATSQLSRYSTNPQAATSTVSSTNPLVVTLQSVNSAISSFWLLILFYPALISAVTYAFVVEVSKFVGGSVATDAMRRVRRFM